MREQVGRGADWIKLFPTGGYAFNKDGEAESALTYPLPVLQALIDETHRLGKKAACHVLGGQGQRYAIIAGCDTIEHAFGLDQEQAQMMVAKGLAYDPTLQRYIEPYMDDNDAKSTGGRFRMIPIFEKAVSMAAATSGMKIMMGSGADGSTYAHGTQALDLEMLVKRAGLPPARALQAATTINAEVLGWQDRIDRRGQVRRPRRRRRRPADRHHRASARGLRDEGRDGGQARRRPGDNEVGRDRNPRRPRCHARPGGTMTMMDRRRFVWTIAAGSAVMARATDLAAAPYDLIIKGGRVIDPSIRLDAVCDVAIAGGRIVAVEPSITLDATDTIDARGKLVVPGLLDIHSHATRVKDGPRLCLADGVTGFIDAGSQGADLLQETLAVANTAPQLCAVLVNIGRAGILPSGDTMDISRADVGAARDAIAKHRGLVVGVKARLSRDVAGPNDYEVLRRAQEVVSAFRLPVMIHMGQTVSPLPRLLGLLKPGDIVTHMFAPPPNGILDENGRVLPEVLAARRRGVWFDVGNGRTGHLRWDVVERVMHAGFWPDTISTDWTPEGRLAQVIDFPNVLSKFLDFGMSLADVIACATRHPSRVFEVFRDRGTLNVGAPADIAVLDLRQGSFEFVDNYEHQRAGRQRLFPSSTILAGKRVVSPAASSVRGPVAAARGLA